MRRISKIINQLKPSDTKSSEETDEYLGVHTCVPAFIELQYVHNFLHGNYKLPPYVITTGNGERVRKCLKYLDQAILLQDVMRALNGDAFRIEIAVGLYKGTPIMIFEHQIGSGSTEIYLKELLSNKLMTNIYKVSSTKKIFTADCKYLIRLGTSLGINDSGQHSQYNPGDIAVSTHQVGISSTDFQAMTSNLNIFNANASIESAAQLLTKIGFKMQTIVDEASKVQETWPVVEFDKGIHAALTESITRNFEGNASGFRCVPTLGNVSKDSLYSEKAPQTFIRLRKHLNVGTSDMEAATIVRTTKQMGYEHENKIKVGFCSVILGVLNPDGGDSFIDFDRKLSTEVQWISALDALHAISLKHMN